MLALPSVPDEARLPQDRQVLGDRRGADRKAGGKVPGGEAPLPEQAEDLPPGRVRQGPQSLLQRQSAAPLPTFNLLVNCILPKARSPVKTCFQRGDVQKTAFTTGRRVCYNAGKFI